MRKSTFAADFSVNRIGLGCSSMSHGYGPALRDDAESLRVIQRAVELGVELFDTADVYGPFTNEKLLGRALRTCRDGVKVATKCGLEVRPDGKFGRNGRPEHVRAACEGSLRRLGTDAIDLLQLHRVDPEVPLAETWGALAELVAEGKVRALGVSHATVAELETVHNIYPITAVQYELSAWMTAHRRDILSWTLANDVGFLAFAPIGRGYLSGHVHHSLLDENDSRRRDPRFSSPAMESNQRIIDGLRRVAERHSATPAQVAIAWTLSQAPNVVAIPGTRRLRWLEENMAAEDLYLTSEDLHDIEMLPAATGEMIWDRPRVAATPQQ